MNLTYATALSLLVLLNACAPAEMTADTGQPAPRAYPAAAKQPVVNRYHGVSVADDYQWLEDAQSAEVKAWVARENKLSRRILDAYPDRKAVFDRVKELLTSTSNDYFDLDYRGGKLFALKREPPKQQPLLVTLQSADDTASERVIIDPNQLNASGATSIDFYEPSLDGSYVAASLSEKGSEDGTLFIFQTATGARLADQVPRVNYPTGGGSVAWNSDGTGFYYTRFPAPGERPEADIHFYQQVYFHRLGTRVSEDQYEIGRDFPRIAEIVLQSSDDGRYVLASVANGDGGDFSFYLKSGERWNPIATFSDAIKQAKFGQDGYLYLLSRSAAPRGKVLRLPLATPMLEQATLLVPQGDATIERLAPAGGKLFVAELLGGPSRLRVADVDSGQIAEVKLPEISGVAQLLHTRGDEVLMRVNSFLAPSAWYRYAAGQKEPRKTALAVASSADFSDAEVVREFAISRDGTRVPLNIIRRKGTALDGRNRTILWGYGGYGVSETPSFSPLRRLWLDQGGVYAIANLRGGGEYGEAWHKAGNLTDKQNVFDDFIAAAQHLETRGYTTSDKLAIVGGSNGGLLMGAALTQQPQRFGAVVSYVGIYDMLRVELDPNGAFNVTEFGTVKDPRQFRALYAYSPYHHVRDGVDYPAVLFVTGDNDGRVNPAHSRKMTARLQAADPDGKPILLRTSASSGHGIGTSLDDRIAEATDVYSFLLSEVGVTFNAKP